MQYSCPDSLKDSRLVCLDIETTGLSPIWNNIIELGVVEVRNGNIVQQYSRLFGGGRSSMFLVRKIHGIKDFEREGKKTFAQCAKRVAEYLNGATLVSHNGVKFDVPFLEAKMKEAGASFSFFKHIDTYLISKKLDHKFHSLEWLCQNYGIPYDESNHRGVTDCLCTLQLLYAFIEKFGADAVLNA